MVGQLIYFTPLHMPQIKMIRINIYSCWCLSCTHLDVRKGRHKPSRSLLEIPAGSRVRINECTVSAFQYNEGMWWITHNFVEHGDVVVDVLNGDFEGADVVQLGDAVVRGADRDVGLLLAARFVSVEDVTCCHVTRVFIYEEIGSVQRGTHERVRHGASFGRGVLVLRANPQDPRVPRLLFTQHRLVQGAVGEYGLVVVLNSNRIQL